MSFLDDLRAVADHVRSQASKTIGIPGSKGKLAVRFRPPADRDKLTPVIAAYKVLGSLTSEQERQLIIDCCDEILHRNGDGELSSYEGGPLRFDASDERWGKDVNTARECVAKLYNLDQQPLAAAGHADALVDWLQGVDAEIAERVEGKSEATEA